MSRNVSRPADRRQFGRRWSDIHGWIIVEGRPRHSCLVRNFSEAGALLMVAGAATLPFTFVLEIEAIQFRIGCEARHRHEGSVGVRFISADLVSEIGPLWSIDEMMAKAGQPKRDLAV